jgi:hypothetical protein
MASTQAAARRRQRETRIAGAAVAMPPEPGVPEGIMTDNCGEPVSPSTRFTLMGVGAMNSPRYAPAGLLIEQSQVRAAIDGGPGADPAGPLGKRSLASPNASWTAWQPFQTQNTTTVEALTAIPLSDGRLQLWVQEVGGAIFTTWIETTNPNSAWTPWSPFPTQ